MGERCGGSGHLQDRETQLGYECPGCQDCQPIPKRVFFPVHKYRFIQEPSKAVRETLEGTNFHVDRIEGSYGDKNWRVFRGDEAICTCPGDKSLCQEIAIKAAIKEGVIEEVL